jgi:hypothetical protein
MASYPTIIEERQMGSGGYAGADALSATYGWLYHHDVSTSRTSPPGTGHDVRRVRARSGPGAGSTYPTR